MTIFRAARYRFPAASLLLLFALAGCGDDGAGKDLRVTNVVDSFQFRVADTHDYDHTYTYFWSNSGGSATVIQSSSITGGDAMLLIKDDSGTTVYAKSLKETGTFTTTSGVAGSWRIQVLANGVSGTLNFQLQKL